MKLWQKYEVCSLCCLSSALNWSFDVSDYRHGSPIPATWRCYRCFFSARGGCVFILADNNGWHDAFPVILNSQPLIQPVPSWFGTGILPVHKVPFCRIYSSICGIAPHPWLAW